MQTLKESILDALSESQRLHYSLEDTANEIICLLGLDYANGTDTPEDIADDDLVVYQTAMFINDNSIR